jgi:hypothetical protein
MFNGMSARKKSGQKGIVLTALICLACMADQGCTHAQQAEGSTPHAAVDCAAFMDSSRKLARTSHDMLNQLKEERNKIENMRDALGVDVSNDFLAHLADQEKHLTKILSDTETVRCPLPSEFPPVGAHD